MSDVYDFMAARLPAEDHANIEAFWRWFEGQADAIDRHFTDGAQYELVSSLQAALNSVSPQLMWEFGPSDRGHCLIITAEGSDELRPLARALVAGAPDLPRWRFHDQRAASADGDVLQLVAARLNRPVATVSAEATLNDGHAVDLATTGSASEDDLVNEAIMLFSVMMGEAADRIWLGYVDGRKKRRGFFARNKPPVGLDVPALRTAVERCIADAQARCPALPFRDTPLDDREIALLQTGGTGAWPREDLVVFSTAYPDMEQAQATGIRFASERYSRHGETFVVASIPREDGQFDDVNARYALEEAIHQALVECQAGGIVGGAHGTGSVYVTAALLDLGSGLPALSQMLSGHPGAAIHFLDPGLGDVSISVGSS